MEAKECWGTIVGQLIVNTLKHIELGYHEFYGFVIPIYSVLGLEENKAWVFNLFLCYWNFSIIFVLLNTPIENMVTLYYIKTIF